MTSYFLFCQGDILLTREGTIPLDVSSLSLKPWNKVTAITVGQRQCEIYRLDAPVTDNPSFRMTPLRQTFDILSAEDYRMAGKCAELVYWDGNSRFCGCCGAPTKWHTEISKHCTSCGKEMWPQLATAIIVRVTKGDEILLVHAKNFRRAYFGLVAGFVETAETLEECVEREVWEETRLRVGNIRYFGSQPWPYPCGLMVAFTADYMSGDIRLQREELTNGGWFSKDNMPEIPGQTSIARWLIDDWLKAR